MDKKKKGLILTVLAIISLIAITIGVTYAFFNYVKEGTTENTITTGTITFLYTETSEVGRGIMLKEAYPISDGQGKSLTGEGNVFDFKITSSNTLDATIPYEITARKKSDSTLPEEAVRIYLTKVNGTEEEVLLDNYSNLTQTEKVLEETHIEKTLYKGKVPSNTNDYEQEYRLRMWVDEDTDFSPVEDEEGNVTYPYNNKTFTITVNVYANAKVVTEEEIASENNTEIGILEVDGVEVTKTDDKTYEMSLPEGTTETTINVETENPNAKVIVEKVDSLTYIEKSNIKRLATAKVLQLNPGENYFKVTVTSENKQIIDSYNLIITVEKVAYFKKDILSRNTVITATPTLTTSSNNTSNKSGLYVSTATNSGETTYYFRGNVTNNYVDFAGFTWRIVRINEDGTVRLIMQNGINNNAKYAFRTSYDNRYSTQMYYSNNSNAKTQLTTWYTTNIVNKGYSDRIASLNNYFCEQAKVAVNNDNATNSGANMAVITSYNPNFKCTADGNGYGIVNDNVGLITYEEVIYAGGYYGKTNPDYYLYNNAISWWTMSPAGRSKNNYLYDWQISNNGSFDTAGHLTNTHCLRPVINLKSDVEFTGTGASNNHYIVR